MPTAGAVIAFRRRQKIDGLVDAVRIVALQCQFLTSILCIIRPLGSRAGMRSGRKPPK
jgi:hypothetical protein